MSERERRIEVLSKVIERQDDKRCTGEPAGRFISDLSPLERIAGLRDCRNCPSERAPMNRMGKAPFVPTEIHIGTVTDEKSVLGILSIQTTEGRLNVALDSQTADAMVKAINAIRSKLNSNR